MKSRKKYRAICNEDRTRDGFHAWLYRGRACLPAIEWVRNRNYSLLEAWKFCRNPNWMMWLLIRLRYNIRPPAGGYISHPGCEKLRMDIHRGSRGAVWSGSPDTSITIFNDYWSTYIRKRIPNPLEFYE